MGLGASQARLLMLTARKSDLELSLQFVQQARMQIANMTSGLFMRNANLTPGSPDAAKIENITAMVQEKDKVLEMESKRLDTQHQAVSTEIDAVSKVIQKNIEGSFKLMG